MMKKSMAKVSILACFVLLLAVLASCGHTHTWVEATCTEPKTCSECHETEGEPLGHSWAEANCTAPVTCTVCGATKGDPLGHGWKDATCTEPKTCSVCGATEGEALGHSWTEATCVAPKTCSVCGETEGEPLGHTVEEWTTEKEATCSEEGIKSGICPTCNESQQEPIPKLEHTPGEWTVTKDATETAPGVRTQSCSVCGAELSSEEFTLTPEEIEKQFKKSCKSYKYKTIARDPDKYLLTRGKYTGKIVQVIEDGDDLQLRVNVTKERYGYTDTIFVYYTRKDGESRLLEDDIITIYGTNFGTISYETVMGATVTIPSVVAEYIDLK